MVLLTGIALQPHRSIFLSSLAGAAVIFLYRSPFNVKIRVAFAVVAVIGSACLFIKADTLSAAFTEPVREVLEQTGAIEARRNINSFRWDEIRNRPLLGHGFIDETSDFGESFYLASDSRFRQTLGTIDSGYVDALARFGIVGTIIILIQYIMVVSIPFRMKSYGTVERLMPAVFLATYFIISMTWSVFTYKHGIIPAAIAIYLITKPTSTCETSVKEHLPLKKDHDRVNIGYRYQSSTVVGTYSP
jgi:O-antigen ligase